MCHARAVHAEDVPAAETQALIVTEDREVERANLLRNICSLPLHRQVTFDTDAQGCQGASDAREPSAPGGEGGAMVGLRADSNGLGSRAKLSVRYTALVDGDASTSSLPRDKPLKQRASLRAKGGEQLPGGPSRVSEDDEDDVGNGVVQGESASAQECGRLLAFSGKWSILKDTVWSGQQLPRGALALSASNFLSVTPGTAWFYRAAGIASVTSLTELYAKLLQVVFAVHGSLSGTRACLWRFLDWATIGRSVHSVGTQRHVFRAECRRANAAR